MAAAPTLHVACLCAAWCRTCDSYRTTLDSVLAEFVASGAADAPRWIDIEDEADLLGDLDVETFPTLVIYDDRHLRFAGPLTQQPEVLRRLLQGLGGPAQADAEAPPGFLPLVRLLRGVRGVRGT